MKIFIGADHDGQEYISQLGQLLQSGGHDVINIGSTSINPNDDYQPFAEELARQLLSANDPEARGILVSGDGQGICMAANRFSGIRASLCWNPNVAKAARAEEDSNVLCLSSHYLSPEEAEAIMEAWLTTSFGNDPNAQRRIQQLDAYTT